jgi:uncharacterized protein (TIGR00369 family)
VEKRTAEMVWQQPALGGYPDPSLLGLSGLERLKAAREGRTPIPPIAFLMEMPFTGLSKGHGAFAMPASPWFANATGLIPGGILAVLADAPLGVGLGTVLEPGVTFTTAELSLTFLRPVRPDPRSTISGSGQLIHRSRSVGLTEAFLINDADDELVAFASSRLSIFPPLDPMPEPPSELPVLEQPYPGESPDQPLRRPLRGEVLAPEQFESRGGREMLEAWLAGELPPPPIYYLTGLRPTSVGDGEAEMVLPCSAWLSTAGRTVQGGFIAMLAEAALAAAVFSTAEAGTAIAPLDLKVNFLRPVFPDEREVTARARVVHRGRTIAISTAELTNADGKAVALATGSAMYVPGRSADLGGVELAADPEDGASGPDR